MIVLKSETKRVPGNRREIDGNKVIEAKKIAIIINFNFWLFQHTLQVHCANACHCRQ